MGISNMDDSSNDETLYQLADLFKVFGDPTRIRILAILSKQELCVQDIADSLSMTQSAISHQLRILKQSALVKFRRDGKPSTTLLPMIMSQRSWHRDWNMYANKCYPVMHTKYTKYDKN